jgi:hypothetical protein
MRERAYPMDGFEQRAADVSVDHPHVVENYRSVHRVTDLSARGAASTEDLRRAMQQSPLPLRRPELRVTLTRYRSFFERLLAT